MTTEKVEKIAAILPQSFGILIPFLVGDNENLNKAIVGTLYIALILQSFANRQVVQEIGPEVAISYGEQLLRRRKLESDLGNLKGIPPTSNLSDRLFSLVKFVFSDYRKSLLPMNLEAQIYLCAKKLLGSKDDSFNCEPVIFHAMFKIHLF